MERRVRENTHHSCTVDQIVQSMHTQHIPDYLQLRARLNSIDAGHVERDDVHRAWSFGAEALESGGREWVATGGEDDVGGVGRELADEFEAEVAGAAGWGSWDGLVS